MKKAILAVVTFVVSAILNEKYKILNTFIDDESLISAIKIVGTVALAYITPKNFGLFREGDGSVIPKKGF